MTDETCPPDGPHQIGIADVPDTGDTVSVLAEAFDGYSWTSWTVPESDHARRLRGLFHVTVSEIAMPHGEVWISRCARSRETVGAAVALRPDRDVPAEVWHRVASAEAELMGERLPAAREAEAACQPLRPAGPHVVLATIGVRRDHQRRGIATALLRQVVRTSDSLGAPTYLETSSRTNVALYQRCGFVLSGSVQIPGGGPTVWGMVRPSGP